MNIVLPGIDPEVKVHGRTRMQNPLPLLWTAAGIEVVTDSTELKIDVETDYDIYEQWIRIEVDGFNMIRMMLPKGKSTIGVFRGMNPGIKRHVRFFREVQPMNDDKSAIVFIKSVTGDGSFFEVPERKYKIEYIGDSLTSGEGLAGSRSFHEWNGISFSTIGSYTELTAERICADYRVISQSGWGVYCGWNNDPNMRLPAVYSQYCGVIDGKYARDLKTHDEYEFKKWRPDAIVVNLGTNDGGSFTSPEWSDPENGRKFKQDIDDGGISTGRFEDAVYDFLGMIREHNPDSYIVWAYGMVSDQMRPYIEEAIQRYRRESRDDRVTYLALPEIKPSWIGGNGHPGQESHKVAADVLTDELKRLLGGKR